MSAARSALGAHGGSAALPPRPPPPTTAPAAAIPANDELRPESMRTICAAPRRAAALPVRA